ncbi:MAG: RNA polymerase sigma factor [Weeksellaceae bacterium]|nr:RNA polymerase sigma factor [Weeksellaceae bacterium]
MLTTEEKDIIALIEKDSNSGFRLLLQTYQKPIYYHIRQMVYNHQDADDITQNTFIKVYKNLSGFKKESKLFSWIYRIATNEALNFLKAQASKKNVSMDEVALHLSSNLESDAFFDADAAELQLQKAVASLPEKQRLVFQMKYFEEMTYEEISEILETSVGALKASFHHARKKVEEFVQSH